ncbi:MAG: ABC transporter ATP-binding protein [Spirochaetaceae bacterium]|nr:MAG: ABC transporter ATP-binding protein [Spirochaetaceae bacterium]
MPTHTRLHGEGKPVYVENLIKRFGDTVAVDNISFTAAAGRLTTLLGPSGCGKTTTLRAIGGFHDADSGDIRIGDRSVLNLSPHRRPTCTVFQSYALFPHLSVFENVAFGLKATRVRRSEIPERVSEALAMVGLEALARRQAGQLSGGQQQRVAFARALVMRPEVLLLDEPLSNLDAKLRVQMRGEIRKIQEEVGVTTIYVTHDQEEAMSLSDRIIVMNEGRIEQQGPPHEIYERPKTRFVAEFIGTSNLVPVTVWETHGNLVEIEAFGARLEVPAPPDFGSDAGQQALAVLRPEHIRVVAAGEPGAIEAVVESCSYLGAAAAYLLRMPDGTLLRSSVAAPRGAALISEGEHSSVIIDAERLYLLPFSSGDSL